MKDFTSSVVLVLIVSIIICFAAALTPLEAQLTDSSTLSGRVQDSHGLPLMGALVAVTYAEAGLSEHFVFTDRTGFFSISNMAAGKYTVRVTKARFIPVVAAGVEVSSGHSAALTINLQTALEIVRRGIRRGSFEEMKWVLRSSASTRPILRLLEGNRTTANAGEETESAEIDTSGYFQLYSTSVGTAAGSADSVGSQFAFSVPLGVGAEMTFTGQYTEAEEQPKGFGATYKLEKGARKSSSLSIRVRQGALIGAGTRTTESRREVRVGYDEQMQWSDALLVNYGADIGHVEGASSRGYLRPAFALVWAPKARTSIRTSFSRKAPSDTDDPIRGREYFDRRIYIPSDSEQYSHKEIGATHILSDSLQVSAAAFRDRLGKQAFFVDAANGSRAIVFFDGRKSSTTGLRLNMERRFQRFEAGVGYTFASGIGFSDEIRVQDDFSSHSERQNFHVITARVKTDIDFTQTAVTAVYRWSSGNSMLPLDPYQRFAEYNDPTLSITIAQDLPSLSIFPAKFQAVIDARNLFEVSLGNRRAIHAQYPRLLKGGIHIKF